MVYRRGSDDAYSETRQAAGFSGIEWDGQGFRVRDGRERHPVIGIRWFGAAAYTNWLSEQHGYEPCYDPATWECNSSKNGYRLPTEAEWEYAGRGGLSAPYRIYPWGDDADPSRANWPSSGDPYEAGPRPLTTPVGFYDGRLHRQADFGWPGNAETYQTADGRNAYGLFDMAGNVWEWCTDWYNRDYYAISPARNPRGPETASPMPDGLWYHVLRSGNWYNGPQGHSRVSNRNPAYFRGPDDPNHAWYHIGFRVVRPAPLFTSVSAASY
ncbi:MAG: formylglycine-generating enzyme family protein, partial [bacterium]|nr:formylglycine-generating enzyme family protein [bacterium]